MVTVNGVRYRSEDAPKDELPEDESKSVTPQNKARKAVPNKSADPSDEK